MAAAALFVGPLWVGGAVVTERGRFYLGRCPPAVPAGSGVAPPLYEEVATQMGLTSVPVLLIDERRNVNAYTGMRHVVLHQGLLDELAQDREAIAAVLAHELGHWRAGDASAMAWAKGVALPLYVSLRSATDCSRCAPGRCSGLCGRSYGASW